MIGLWLLAGGLVGMVNSLTRQWAVARLQAEMQGSALSLILGGLALRLALVAVLLIAGLKHGIVPGLLAFGGLWLARSAAVIWIQASGPPWLSSSGSGDPNDASEFQRGW